MMPLMKTRQKTIHGVRRTELSLLSGTTNTAISVAAWQSSGFLARLFSFCPATVLRRLPRRANRNQEEHGDRQVRKSSRQHGAKRSRGPILQRCEHKQHGGIRKRRPLRVPRLSKQHQSEQQDGC